MLLFLQIGQNLRNQKHINSIYLYLTYYYFLYCRLFNTDRIKIVDGGNKVRISNINAEDNGIYSCRSENVAGAIDSTGDFLLNKPGKTFKNRPL